MVGFAGPTAPRLCLLAGRVLLLYWDDGGGEPPTKLAVRCAGTSVPAPVLRLSAPREAAGARQFLAFAAPRDAGPIEAASATGPLFAVERAGAEAATADAAYFDTAAMLSGLTDGGRVRLVRFLLHTCRTALGIGGDAAYGANMRRFVDELSLRPGTLEPRALLCRQHIIATGSLPAPLGDNPVAFILDGDRVEETLLPPSVGAPGSAGKGRHALCLALPRRAIAGEGRVVMLGGAGVAVRRLAAPADVLRPIVAVLAGGGSAALRDHALDCLTTLGSADKDAAQAAREVIVLASPDGLAIKPDCAIAAGKRLFLSGSLGDPHGLITGLEIRIGRWAATVERGAIATFVSSRGVRGDAGDTPARRGFAVLAAGSAPVPPSGIARIAARLRSGASIEAGGFPVMTDIARAPAAVLQAVPETAVTDTVLQDILAPALDALAEQAARVPPAQPDVMPFGAPPPAARASLIIPFGADPGMLASWTAAVGGGVWNVAAAELIFVLPPGMPPEAAERALAALDRRFGVASRLVCPPAAAHADTFDLGARAARCDRLVFLGAACLPQERNAIAALLAELRAEDGCGAVGGAVLDPSGAIRHAGFAAPLRGALMPRHAGFPAACLHRERTRPVFACSSAFLAVRRAVLEAADGFSGGWCTRDWADADFCLTARAAGHAVRSTPRARVVGYGAERDPRRPRSPVAERIDAWRFARKWAKEIDNWREEGAGADSREAEQRRMAPPGAVVDPRWAA